MARRLCGLILLAHARPDVRVDEMDHSPNRLDGILDVYR